MSRQYSLFSSARAKARREKFASTRKTLTENWGNLEEDGGGSYPELPSPTIGHQREHHPLLSSNSVISPLAIFTTTATASVHCNPYGGSGNQRGRKGTSSCEGSPKLFGRKRDVFYIRDVSTQCNIHQCSRIQQSASNITGVGVVGPVTEEFETIDEESCPFLFADAPFRPWKSFDWGDVSQWSTPPWEPFYPLPSLPPLEPPSGKGTVVQGGITKRLSEPPSKLDLICGPGGKKGTTWSSSGATSCSTSGSIAVGSSGTDLSTAVCDKCAKILKSKCAGEKGKSVVGGAKQNFPIDSMATCGSEQKGPGSKFKKEMIVSGGLGKGKESTVPPNNSTPQDISSVGGTRTIFALRNAEKRRRFFAKKQNNSAPDSYDTHTLQNVTRRLCGYCKEPVTLCLDGVLRAKRREKGDTSTITPPSVEVWESEIRTARCGDVAVTHVSELDYPDADPPCHFCCEQASTAIHDESRLQIVSGGLVRSRDGSTRSGSAPYINLPSPNVQTENGQAAFGSLDLSPSMSLSQNLLSPGSHHALPCPHQHRLSAVSGGGGTLPSSRGGSIPSSISGVGGLKEFHGIEEESPLVGPPASALTRRPALVPPKLIPDPDYETDPLGDRGENRRSVDDMSCSPRNRRSSIVVIPPMQICPGDLLVYGKVLSQRKSLLGTPIESPSPIPTIFDGENNQGRKGKATWSLLRLFERGSRSKGGPTGTLEDIMNLIQPCDFSDPKLSRFKGMLWTDFVAHVANQKTKKSGSVVSSGSSSGPSTSSSVNDFSGPLTSSLVTGGVVPSTSISSTLGASTGGVGVAPSTSGGISSLLSSPTKVITAPPKPIVRKRMGLMRTMSDRCLERRITPALFRGSAGGFLMSEKLVEGKETECGASSSSGKKVPEGMSSAASTSAQLTLNLSLGVMGTGAGSGDGEGGPSSAGGSRKGSGADEDPEERQKLRQKEALWDLFQSESSFLYDHLMVLKNVYMEPLKRIQVEGFAMYAEPELLFGNLDELCAVTYAFCKEFIHLLLTQTDILGQLGTTQVLARLFEPSSKARIMSQAYHRYALNYINALNYLETLRRHVEFCDYEKLCMKDPRCKKLQLTDLLVSPVQHLMKVPLILKDIQSRTNQPQEKELIAQILEIQENSIRELDDKMRWLKNFERLLEIQRNIIWPSILEMEPKTWVPEFLRVALGRQPCDSIIVSPRRQIIHEGLLQLWDTGKPSECYVILFDDMLLITRRKKGLSKKKSSLTENWQSACNKATGGGGGEGGTNHRYIVYRQPISLDRFFIHDIGEGESSSAKLDYAFVLVSLNRFQQIIAVHTFQAPAEQIKNTWLLKLKTTQDKWKRTLQTTVFRGVRSSTDSGQSNVASSILGLAHNKSFLHRHNTCESSN